MSGSDLSKKVAILFTDRIKGEMMNCYDVVATGRYPYTGYFGVLGDKDREVIENTMKLVKVKDLCDKDFKKISDGQRQRIMLARALCQEPAGQHPGAERQPARGPGPCGGRPWRNVTQDRE